MGVKWHVLNVLQLLLIIFMQETCVVIANSQRIYDKASTIIKLKIGLPLIWLWLSKVQYMCVGFLIKTRVFTTCVDY